MRKYRVRVISGALKGRALEYPADLGLRPTMQRAKASVFESLGGLVPDCVFLDLFAGAGGIGLEALSRGARMVHFVESDRAALGCLRRNLTACGVGADRYRVHPLRVERFLEGGGMAGARPDIIYADPPYGAEGMSVLLAFFARMEYPSWRYLIVEHERRSTLAASGKLVKEKDRLFGQTCITFLVARAGGES